MDSERPDIPPSPRCKTCSTLISLDLDNSLTRLLDDRQALGEMATCGVTEYSLVCGRICSGSPDVRDLPNLPQRWPPFLHVGPTCPNIPLTAAYHPLSSLTPCCRVMDCGRCESLRLDGHEERDSLLYLRVIRPRVSTSYSVLSTFTPFWTRLAFGLYDHISTRLP